MFRSPLCVAFSASLASLSMKLRLSFLACFFTSLSFSLYNFWSCSFFRADLMFKVFSLSFVLSSMVSQVYWDNQFWSFLFLYPKVFSAVCWYIVLMFCHCFSRGLSSSCSRFSSILNRFLSSILNFLWMSCSLRSSVLNTFLFDLLLSDDFFS